MHKTCSSSRSRTRRCVHARVKANARTYDANGNRLTSLQTTGSSGAAQTTRRTYTVDAASNRILSFTQTQLAGTATTGGATSNLNYSFDANGSLLKDGLRSYEFDAANRLGNVTTGTGPDAPTTRYVHNALGQRLFKTEPLYAPVSSGSNPADPGVIQTLANFFASLWGGSTNTAAPSASEKLGYTYYYDEDGSLLYEQGSGGANSGGSSHYVYLPTPAGPMPIATYTGSKHYAVHTDHLNTPRRLTNSAKQVAWQWAFSAFGDEQPTTARNRFVDPATTPNAGTTTVAEVTFNLRYPEQYFDKESNLNYNYFRSYDSRTGRYTQADPIGLDGGWNRFGYVGGNPLMYSDPMGLRGLLGPGAGIGIGVGGIGIINAVRPAGLSPPLESLYDRYCKDTADPCAAIKAELNQAINDARKKMNNMLNDDPVSGLYRNAMNTPNPTITGTRTTWRGHVDDLDGRIGKINNLIALGQKMGCDLSREIADAMTLNVPVRPLR